MTTTHLYTKSDDDSRKVQREMSAQVAQLGGTISVSLTFGMPESVVVVELPAGASELDLEAVASLVVREETLGAAEPEHLDG